MSNPLGSRGTHLELEPDAYIAGAIKNACKEAGIELRIKEQRPCNAGLSPARALARQMRGLVKEMRRLEDARTQMIREIGS